MTRELYPDTAPYNTGHLQVDDLHSLYYAEYGRADGVPVVYLHGGPGGGSGPFAHRFFDPAAFRIVVFDQRGCGQSRPFGETRANTPDLLVGDIEALRSLLGVDRWHVFGGSWGSTLALLYAQAHAGRVLSLTLRGIFTMRQQELDCFYESNILFPEEFATLRAFIPEAERDSLLRAYRKRIAAGDVEAARVWSRYEGATSYLEKKPSDTADDDNHLVGMATMETHFFVNCRFEPDDRVLRDMPVIRAAGIPGFIVQGRYDAVCPASTARELKIAWPEAELVMVTAGHAAREPATLDALIGATDAIRDFGSPIGKAAK